MASWLRGENPFKNCKTFYQVMHFAEMSRHEGKRVSVIIHQLREFGMMIPFNGRQLAKSFAGLPLRGQCPRAEKVPRGLAHGGNNDHRV